MSVSRTSVTMPKTQNEIIALKRDGKEFSKEDIETWITKLLSNELTEAQLGAWLMACYINGLNFRETADLTNVMAEIGGEVFHWPEDWKPYVVDKHSTGGVGDKVSLVLAPALAANGRKVPMISGRGLGLTGGTLDKLESIKGFRVNLSSDEVKEGLEKVGKYIPTVLGIPWIRYM